MRKINRVSIHSTHTHTHTRARNRTHKQQQYHWQRPVFSLRLYAFIFHYLFVNVHIILADIYDSHRHRECQQIPSVHFRSVSSRFVSSRAVSFRPALFCLSLHRKLFLPVTKPHHKDDNTSIQYFLSFFMYIWPIIHQLSVFSVCLFYIVFLPSPLLVDSIREIRLPIILWGV